MPAPPSFKIPDLEWNRNLTLGVVLLKSGSFSQAIQVFNAMLKVSPHDPTILQVLNYAKSKLRKENEGKGKLCSLAADRINE